MSHLPFLMTIPFLIHHVLLDAVLDGERYLRSDGRSQGNARDINLGVGFRCVRYLQ